MQLDAHAVIQAGMCVVMQAKETGDGAVPALQSGTEEAAPDAFSGQQKLLAAHSMLALRMFQLVK